MTDENKKPIQADWEPGTLDKTRQAIGKIDPIEAEAMAQKLGGKVMYERSSSASQNSSSQPNKNGRIIRNQTSNSSPKPQETTQKATPSRGRNKQEELIQIPAKLSTQIDHLMMSSEYEIKPNYGIFNFIKYFQNKGHEQVITEFCTVTLKHHIENLQSFITVIKTLIQIAPSSYKTKIANSNEPKFKFLRMVAGWNMQGIKLAHIELQDLPQPYYVQDLIPYVKATYRLLIQVYYYGENKIPKLIKEIYTDENSYQDAPHEKLSLFAKEAITSWLYIQNEIVKKLYPLLMRMCSDTFESYPDFFRVKVAEILKFVGLHKYDLLLPEKPKDENGAEKVQDENSKPKAPARPTRGMKDSVVVTGLSLLEQLFPQAGFKNLENHPDMFPYFQPLYKFADGFNVLSPENPLQVTVVLLKIVEDLFQGCRNIVFSEQVLSNSSSKITDNIANVLEEWANYRETYFERFYCEPLNDFVNQAYSQEDFENTQYGRKLLTNIMWQTQYLFLPNFKFDQLTLERPANEGKLMPLGTRTDFIRKFLTEVVAQCDAASSTRGPVSKVQNPWEHYRFDIQNEVSKRLDILLGAKNTSPTTNANNANLLKYTLCIISVLDWWINNPDSPAYTTSPRHIYRISEVDGRPKFSVPERTDQNHLFVEQIKAAMQAKK